MYFFVKFLPKKLCLYQVPSILVLVCNDICKTKDSQHKMNVFWSTYTLVGVLYLLTEGEYFSFITCTFTLLIVCRAKVLWKTEKKITQDQNQYYSVQIGSMVFCSEKSGSIETIKW